MPALRAVVKPASPAVDQIFCPAAQVRIEWFDRRGVHFSYRTLVEDITATALVLQAPLEGRSVVRLAPNTEVTLWAALHEDGHVAMVRVAELRTDNPPLLWVTRPVRVEKTTRRRFYRIDTHLEIRGDGWRGLLLNLSASGCLLLIPEDQRGGYPDGSRVSLPLALPPVSEPVEVAGRVVRRAEANGGLRLGIEFTRLNRRQEDCIVRYAMQRQREMLARGLLRHET